ncbi:hypothetical protein [Paenibacillus marinisediminis]
MLERIIEYGFGFFIDIVRGDYPFQIVLGVIILAIAAGLAEVWACKLRRVSLGSYKWLKVGLESALGSFLLIGFSVFVFKSLGRAFPKAGFPAPDQSELLAGLGIATMAVALAECILVELAVVKRKSIELNAFWLLLGFSGTVVSAFVLRWILVLPQATDIVYISAGILATLTTVGLSSIRQESEQESDGVADPAEAST